jgi:hypothetical protein
METKEDLINKIKQWVQIDNEIKELNQNMKKIRLVVKEKNIAKNLISGELIEVMKKNTIDCFDTNSGCLVFKQSFPKKPINRQTLIQTLKTFYNDSLKAEEMTKYIYDNREKTVKETIKKKNAK